jgi:hypothetical protein
MPADLMLSLISVALATAALTTSGWIALRHMRVASNANEIQVVADLFGEVRSAQFRTSFNAILALPADTLLEDGFESLDASLREHAYVVCYFFEHLGVLIVKGLIPGETLLATMCTPVVRAWQALLPAITAERAHRTRTYTPQMGRAFLPHFERLVRMAQARHHRSRRVPRVRTAVTASRNTRPAVAASTDPPATPAGAD